MKCHNIAVTVERDVRLTPSPKACAGCASEKLAPCENTDSLIREVDHPMTHGTTPADTSEPETLGSAAPGKPSTIRELERSLRGLGYSQREAKAIALGGFKSLRAEPDDLTQLADKLQELADIFRK